MKEQLIQLLAELNKLKAISRADSLEAHKLNQHNRVAIKEGEYIAFILCITKLEKILKANEQN